MNNAKMTILDPNQPNPNAKRHLDQYDLEAEAEGQAIARTTILQLNRGKQNNGSSRGGKNVTVCGGSGINSHKARRLWKVA